MKTTRVLVSDPGTALSTAAAMQPPNAAPIQGHHTVATPNGPNPPSSAIHAFNNPATQTAYRLVTVTDRWRITRSRTVGSRVVLVHLRGRTGNGSIDTGAVQRLVDGVGGESLPSPSPDKMFAAVVLCDIRSAADVLMIIADEAINICKDGCPGFRPGCTVLRQQRDGSATRARIECRQMAAAWQASGLSAECVLPQWMVTAAS